MKIYCNYNSSAKILKRFVGKDIWILCMIQGAGKWYIKILSSDPSFSRCQINRVPYSLVTEYTQIIDPVIKERYTERVYIEYTSVLIPVTPVEAYSTEELFGSWNDNKDESKELIEEEVDELPFDEFDE